MKTHLTERIVKNAQPDSARNIIVVDDELVGFGLRITPSGAKAFVLNLLDTFVQMAVESRSETSPPGSPADGEVYIPASGATGDWSGWDFNLAVARDGAWTKIVPKRGMKAWVKDERLSVVYEDSVWRDGVAVTQHGGRITLRAKEEELTLTGAFGRPPARGRGREARAPHPRREQCHG